MKKHTVNNIFIGNLYTQEDYFIKLNFLQKIAQRNYTILKTFKKYLLLTSSLEILNKFTVPGFLKSPQH